MLVSITAFAQTGNIKGSIKTSDRYPAEAVIIGLKKTTFSVTSEKDGTYEIKKVNPGTYTLVASLAGLETKEMAVEVKGNETTTIPEIVLKENAKELSEVVVSTRNMNRENTVIAKMPLKNLENPQVYNTVSAELLKQQAITDYDDAMRNVPGITRTWASTGRAGDGASYFALRGFDASPR